MPRPLTVKVVSDARSEELLPPTPGFKSDVEVETASLTSSVKSKVTKIRRSVLQTIRRPGGRRKRTLVESVETPENVNINAPTPNITITNSGTKPNENAFEPGSPPARSKSRLIRMLTTKKPQDPSPNARRPGAASAYSKEQRQAALRARGLLPALTLSEQERELDRTVPVVKLEPAVEEEGKVSAADLIKKQWETQNKDRQEKEVERLGTFKFGASSTSTTPSTLQPNEPNDCSRSLSSETESIPKSTKASRRHGLHKASLSQSMLAEAESLRNLDHKRVRSGQNKTLPVPPEEQKPDSAPVTPILDLPSEFQSYLDAPPSPKAPATQLPLQSSVPASSSTSSGAQAASGQHSPRPAKHEEPLPPSKGTLDSIVSPTDTLVNGRHARNDSLPRAGSGSSSIQTPSLDSSSTAKSSESLPGAKSPKPQLKSVENSIPVIVECPSEPRDHKAQTAEHVAFADKAALSSSSHGHTSEGDDDKPPPIPPRDAEKGRKRGITDPPTAKPQVVDQAAAETGAPVVRRKTINPFKRNQQAGDDSGKSKRNMFSRVGTVLKAREKFTNTPAPLSPTSPRSRPAYNAASPPHSPTKPVVRQAVNPVYYSGGDIQAQASTIKDEEERRMAELAFLS